MGIESLSIGTSLDQNNVPDEIKKVTTKGLLSLKSDIKVTRNSDITALSGGHALNTGGMALATLGATFVGVAEGGLGLPLAAVGLMGTIAVGKDTIDNISKSFSERKDIKGAVLPSEPQAFQELKKELTSLSMEDLKKIGLGDALLGLDKGIEFDAGKGIIHLDFSGTRDGYISKDVKGSYHLVYIEERQSFGQIGRSFAEDMRRPVFYLEGDTLKGLFLKIQEINQKVKSNKYYSGA